MDTPLSRRTGPVAAHRFGYAIATAINFPLVVRLVLVVAVGGAVGALVQFAALIREMS
jgi:hypothetical protein